MKSELKNVCVLGAGGAIGRAMVDKYASLAEVENVVCFSREKIECVDEKVHAHMLDYHNENSINEAAAICDDFGGMHLIIVTTGILHAPGLNPEKSLLDIESQNLHTLFQIDTVVPVLLVKHFMGKLCQKKQSVMAILTARVGSIGDNRLGGWYSYRMAKSALNMFIKSVSIEVKRRHKHQIVIGLHPGTVDSDLSKPFQSHLDPSHIFSPSQSADYLHEVISNLSLDDTGKIKAWDGSEIDP